MSKLGTDGSINVLLIPFVLTLVFLLGAAGFGAWAFSSRQDYKNNVDEKIAVAEEIARKETASQKDSEFIEREKRPLKDYNGPDAYGSVNIKFPKSWSAYVEEGTGTAPLSAYFHPDAVPDAQSDASYALRLEVVNETFDRQVQKFENSVRSGKAKAKPYKPVNVDNAVGLQITGELDNRKQGVMVILQIRDKTLRIWTEADQFEKDFFESVLPNLKFVP